MKWNHSISR